MELMCKLCYLILLLTILNVIYSKDCAPTHGYGLPFLRYTSGNPNLGHPLTGLANRTSSDMEVLRNSLHHLKVQKKSQTHLFSTTCRSKTLSVMYLALLLLTNASDIELNPGPINKYPCQICTRPVTWQQRGVACDDCDQWYHVECMHMSTPVYEALAHVNVSWHCTSCGMPQFSTSLFNSYVADTSNAFSALSSLTSDDSSTVPLSPGPPLASSSPSRHTTRRKHPDQKRKMKILTVNFQSARNKQEEINNLIESSDPDIILGTETWLNSNVYSAELFPPSYEVIRKDRSDGYGGVLIALKKNIVFEQLPGIIGLDVEATFIKIPLCKKNFLIVGALYRPPSSTSQYMEHLCQSVESLHSQYGNAVIWLGGDLNLPDINWETRSSSGNQYPMPIKQRFLEMLENCDLEQMVSFPTRLNNCLDLFLSNRPTLVDKCAALPGLGDHDIVLVESSVLACRNRPVKRKVFLWKHANMEDLREDCLAFQQAFTERFNSSSSVQVMWDNIKSTLLQLMGKHVPSKMTSTRFSQPWISRSLKQLTRRKKRSFDRAKASNNSKDNERYLALKKQTKKACRNAYNKYVEDIVSPDSSTNPKRFWSFINSKRCDSSGVASLKSSDGIMYSDSASKANILNNQFSSVFTRNEDMTNIKDRGSSPYPAMEAIIIQPAGVLKILSELQVHKATGPDDLPSRLLKSLAHELTPVLTVLFQASLDQGEVPKDWKEANVAPVFKKGERSKPENYRPISLTSITCKVLEHIVHSSVMDHLEDHNILSDAQHGFRKKRSCVSQLVLAIQDLARGIDNREQLDVILLDFSKAFDKVPHGRLLHKLHYYGIRNSAHAWIADFLRNRTQQVILEGSSSTKAQVASGVPQGSVVGPMLFLLFINDLPEYLSTDTTVRLFADDCLLYRSIMSEADSLQLQEDINSLEQWEADWLMEFNPQKCQVLHVSNKRKPIIKSYVIHGHTLKEADTAKYLGIHLHKKLSWNYHIDQISKKANSTRAFLQRNIRSCPRRVKVLCYLTLLRPVMEYASVIWDPFTQANIKKLEMVQRRYARFVCNDHHRASSVTAMLDQLQWPSLQERRAQAKVVIIYCINNSLISIPQAVLTPSLPASQRGHDQKLQVPYARTQVLQRSFFPDAIRLWNSLPQAAVSCTSLLSFKQGVSKVHLR